MRLIFVSMVRLYRYFLSPFIGGHCRFEPTCSCYAEEAFKCHGFFRAFHLSTLRILRCNPWHPGGFDPVPAVDEKITHG